MLGFFVILAVIRLRLAEPPPASLLVCITMGVLGVLVQGYIGGELVYRYGAGVRAVQVLSARPPAPEQQKASEGASSEASPSEQ